GQIQVEPRFLDPHRFQPGELRGVADEVEGVVSDRKFLHRERSRPAAFSGEIDSVESEAGPEISPDIKPARESLGSGSLFGGESGEHAEARSVEEEGEEREKDKKEKKQRDKTSPPLLLLG